MGIPPNHPFKMVIFHCKPSILHYPHLWTPPWPLLFSMIPSRCQASLRRLNASETLTALTSLLRANGASFLRAFCWLSLPDYVRCQLEGVHTMWGPRFDS